MNKYDGLKTRLDEALYDLDELRKRIWARQYNNAGLSFAHLADTERCIFQIAGALHVLRSQVMKEWWDSNKDSDIDADSTAEVIELLDKLTKGWEEKDV